MYVRLAFAVAAHLDPEILIVDEVLAVGDAAFQKKCLGKMGEVSERDGRTVLFVSHNMVAVKSLCEKSILLSNGYVLDKGNTYEITDLYLNQLIGERVTKLEFKEDSNLSIQFLSVDLINKINSNAQEIIIIEFQYLVRQETDNILLCVEIQNSSGEVIFYFNDSTIKDKKKRQIGVHNVSLTIPKHLLTAGDYFVAFGFWEPGHTPIHFPDQKLFFHKDEPSHSLSKHGIRWPGFLYLPDSWEYEKIFV